MSENTLEDLIQERQRLRVEADYLREELREKVWSLHAVRAEAYKNLREAYNLLASARAACGNIYGRQ